MAELRQEAGVGDEDQGEHIHPGAGLTATQLLEQGKPTWLLGSQNTL